MDTMVDDANADKRPGNPGKQLRPGQSGEGSRSALDLLIQLEQRREAQRLREEEGPAPADPAP
jgi:hypothetical protein